MGVAVSSSHIVSAALSSSGEGLLTLFPCSSARSLSQKTVLHKRLQIKSFPWAAALHKLPQHVFLPTGCSPSGTGCSSVGAAWGHKYCQQTCSSVGSSLSMGPLVLPEACSSTGSPWGHSLLQACTCSSVGSIPWATGGYLLHRGPPWTAGGQPASPWSSA